MSGDRWHPAYREQVLHPDFRFAAQHLAPHFLDAMSAHVRTVARLEDDEVREHRGDIARLLAKLVELRDEPVPEYESGVPDLYFAFNARLEAELGRAPVGFLRLGLSRNDLDMTVYKLRARELLLRVIANLLRLRRALHGQARAHLETVFIAQTHHQPGQPTTVAHYLMAIDAALARDLARLESAWSRINTCPLGAAALAGSSFALDRELTARLLGFDAPVVNTYDAVASADWELDFAHGLQSLALTLSRFVYDLLAWSSQGLYRLADSLVQGSSIMPQKRNPVALEHARTRFSRTLGSAQMVLFSSHNIPYADLNDFGPDIQGALTSMYLQLDGGLALMIACLEEGSFDRQRLARQVACTDTTATELADELVRRHGLPFQEGHRLAAALVDKLCREERPLLEATPDDLLALGGPRLDAAALAGALDPATFVRRRAGLGGPAPAAVRPQLEAAVAALAAADARLEARRAALQRVRRALSDPDPFVADPVSPAPSAPGKETA